MKKKQKVLIAYNFLLLNNLMLITYGKLDGFETVLYCGWLFLQSFSSQAWQLLQYAKPSPNVSFLIQQPPCSGSELPSAKQFRQQKPAKLVSCFEEKDESRRASSPFSEASSLRKRRQLLDISTTKKK